MRKSNYKTQFVSRLSSLIALVLLSCTASFGQLSGTYKIGGASPNYATFTAAVSALTTNGISGPVKFLVDTGTYNENIEIPAITGSSSTNTITFEGGNGNQATRILTSAGTSTSYATVYLNGCSYVNFRNITIQGTDGANQRVVTIGSGTSYNTFTKCLIRCAGSTAPTSGSGNFMAVTFSASPTSNSTVSNTQNNSFDSCIVRNGYHSFFMQATTGTVNNQIRWCKVENYVFTGFYCFTGINIKCISDTFVGRPGQHGLYLGNFNGNATAITEIRNCVITKNTAGGISTYTSFQSGTSSNPHYITNNLIYGGFTSTGAWGLRISYARFTNVWHNTVVMDNAGTVTTTGALYWTGNTSSSPDIRNNNFVVSNTSSLTPAFYIDAASTATVIDYNNYYHANSSANLVNIVGAFYNANNFKGQGGYNTNSESQNPNFVSATDLRMQSQCLSGIQISNAYVDKDFQDTTRKNPPKIGAYETVVGSISNDLGIAQISSQTPPVSTGLQDVTVILRNFGTNAITSATVSYSVNGGTRVDSVFSGSIPACGTLTFSFTGSKRYNFSNGLYSILAYVTNPNAATDPNKGNDTARKIVHTPLSGLYTINKTGSGTRNFTSFTNAAVALNFGGVSGEVTFMVKADTFTEQIAINNVSGVSTTNRVRFIGEDPDSSKTILRFGSSTSDGNNYVVRISNCNFISFHRMTLENNSTGTFSTVIYLNSTSNDSFTRCLIVGTAGSTSANKTCIYSVGSDNNNVVRGNALLNNSFGVFIGNTTVGARTGWVIENNKMTDQYYMFMYLYYNINNILVNNNYCTTSSAFTNFYGIYYYYSTAASARITNNTIYTPSGIYGMYFGFLYGVHTATNPFYVYNNNVYLGGSTNNAAGVISLYNSYLYFVNNNIVYDGTNSGGSAFRLDNGGSSTYSNNRVLNNNLTATDGGLTFYCTYATIFSGVNARCNNNNHYAPNSFDLAYYDGNYYSSFTAFKAGSGCDSNGLNINPNYASITSPYDLTASANGLASAGLRQSYVTTDIKGATRPLVPSIGANEVSLLKLDAGASSVDSLKSTNCVGTYRIVATIRNFGSDTLKSVTTSWSVNGTVQGGVLRNNISVSTGNTLSGIFLGNYNFTAAGNYVIKVWTSNPNGGTDLSLANDTATYNVTILSRLAPTITGPLNLCPGQSTVYSTSRTGITSFNWSASSGTINSGSTADTMRYTAPNSGTTNIKVIVSNGSCVDSATISVNINPYPTAGFTGKDTVCAGSTENYSSAGTANVSYTWTVNGGTLNTGGAGANITWGTASSGSLKLVARTLAGCSDSVTKTITILAAPSVAFTGDTLICLGDTGNYAVTSPSTNLVYSWTATGLSTTSLGNTLAFVFPTSGTKTVSVTATNSSGCRNTASISNVEVLPAPNAKFSFTNNNLGLYNFGSNDTTLTTYSWDFGVTGGSANTAKAQYQYTANGKYLVKLSVVDANGCKNEDTTTVNVLITSLESASGLVSEVKVWPVPARNEVFVSANASVNERLVVMDVQGKIMNSVRSEVVSTDGEKVTYRLDINALAKGMYILQINNEKQSKQIRIQKMD